MILINVALGELGGKVVAAMKKQAGHFLAHIWTHSGVKVLPCTGRSFPVVFWSHLITLKTAGRVSSKMTLHFGGQYPHLIKPFPLNLASIIHIFKPSGALRNAPR